jgi:hypothetical protein
MLTQKEALAQLVATWTNLKNDKAARLSHWQKLYEYTIPHKAAVETPFDASARPYAEKYDGTGMLAAMEFAANLYTHLSPPNKRWFLLSPPAGSALARDEGYGRYLGDRTEDLHLALAQTNSETELHNVYEDLAAGTACLAVAKDPEVAFVLSARPIGEYTFLMDHRGRVDTVFVERQWTAYQAAQQFGLAKLPEALQRSLQGAEPAAYTSTATYLNVHRPNEQWDPTSLASRRYRYESLWIEPGENRLLERGGMRRLRYVIGRFWRPTGLTWGMGPSDLAYSWIRCLDKASELVLKYAAKAMDPPLIAPDDGSFHPLSREPGTLIRRRMGATDAAKPEYLELTADHRLTEFLFQYYSALILRAYMQDLFRVLDTDRQKTATEIMSVLQRSYDIAIPVLGRLKAEIFTPLLRICLELLTEYELGVHGWNYGGRPLPEYQYDLELISPLALAVKFAELQGMSDLVAMNSRLADIDSGVWDNYSLNDMSRAIGENMGVPRRWLRSVTEVRAIQERRAQLLAEQRLMEQAKLAGDAARGLGKEVERGSPAAALMGEAA